MNSQIVKILLLIILMLGAALTRADFNPGNILVSDNNVIYEYTADNQLISQTFIPLNSYGESARDFVVMANGKLAVFNGTLNPELAIYDGVNWTISSEAGWSTPNNISYGGIATLEDKVYVSDGYTYNGGESKGIIVFDTTTDGKQRFQEQNEYIDITKGNDGLLYALRNTYGDLDVLDPVSMTLLKSVDLGHTSGSRGVTADEYGNIFMASWSGSVTKYDSNGIAIDSILIGGNLTDIDIDEEGRLLVGSRFGSAYLIEANLSNYVEIIAGNGATFVSFVPNVNVIEAPELSGESYRKGRWIQTTLSWITEADAVDIYLNGMLIDTVVGDKSAQYTYSRKESQVYTVCNSGTNDCSVDYVAN